MCLDTLGDPQRLLVWGPRWYDFPARVRPGSALIPRHRRPRPAGQEGTPLTRQAEVAEVAGTHQPWHWESCDLTSWQVCPDSANGH